MQKKDFIGILVLVVFLTIFIGIVIGVAVGSVSTEKRMNKNVDESYLAFHVEYEKNTKLVKKLMDTEIQLQCLSLLYNSRADQFSFEKIPLDKDSFPTINLAGYRFN